MVYPPGYKVSQLDYERCKSWTRRPHLVSKLPNSQTPASSHWLTGQICIAESLPGRNVDLGCERNPATTGGVPSIPYNVTEPLQRTTDFTSTPRSVNIPCADVTPPKNTLGTYKPGLRHRAQTVNDLTPSQHMQLLQLLLPESLWPNVSAVKRWEESLERVRRQPYLIIGKWWD